MLIELNNLTYSIGFAFKPINSLDDIKDLRDALMEVLEICVSYKEAKDVAEPYHLYLLSRMIKELTKDLEQSKEGVTV